MDEMDEELEFLNPPPTNSGNPQDSLPPSFNDAPTQQSLEGIPVVLDQLKKTLVEEISKCSTIAGLVKLVPVPAQPTSKDIFEEVFTACQKKGAAEILLRQWQRHLADSAFDKVSALNAIKAPSVQVCKEALKGTSDAALAGMNFEKVVLDAKTAALTQMIAIKNKEFTNLVTFTSRRVVDTRLAGCWNDISARTQLIPEHLAILSDPDIGRRMSAMATAIGESAYLRITNQKQKAQESKDEAKKNSTDPKSDKGQKNMMALINEVFNRREQSRRDKTSNKRKSSGNGKRGAGPSKNQNQKKTGKKTGSNRVQKSGKSTKKQQKRR